MALGIFNSKFTITSSTPSGENYEVSGDVLDSSGFFSGYDIETGDVVYIDISNSPVDNAYVARYRVLSIVSQDAFTATLILRYMDGSSIPDPNDYINQPGIICRSSTNLSMGWVAAYSLQSTPEYLSTYAGNIDKFTQIDGASFTGSGATGPVGATGIEGIQGATGYVGVTGVDGSIGVTGVQGATGYVGVTGIDGSIGATGIQGFTGISGISGETGVQGVTGLSGGAGVTGLTAGYIPVAVTGVISLLDSYVSQGRVDPSSANTPIISYNSTPFFTPPTGNLNNRLYVQYHPLMNHVVIDLVGAGIYPSYCYEFSGVYNDDMAGMTLTAEGYGNYWLFSPLGLMFGGTEAGSLGDVKAIEQNRAFVVQDFGPGGITNFSLGYSFFSDGVFPYCTFLVGNQGAGRGGSMVVGASSDDIGETDQASLHFVKNHSDIATIPVATIDTEPLGLIRFRGTPSVLDTIFNSLFDARIRAVQNGAAATDGVPVNLYFETSNGTAWNLNQFVASSDNKVGIGKQPSLAKLDVSGDVAISTVDARPIPATVFLTMETGIIRSRTAAQVLSDIGAGATGTSFYTGAIDFPYSPATGVFWDSPVPTTVQQALDRIARAVYYGETGPIKL